LAVDAFVVAVGHAGARAVPEDLFLGRHALAEWIVSRGTAGFAATTGTGVTAATSGTGVDLAAATGGRGVAVAATTASLKAAVIDDLGPKENASPRLSVGSGLANRTTL
jgi:hypothetical protein